jgi:segregation and condensation protein A
MGSMATSSESSQVQVDLNELVKEPTWKSLLIELIDTKKLDPWNIDIIELVDGYIELVRKMELLDLRVPANIILASSILLRMKSDTIRMLEETPIEEIVEGSEIIRQIPEIPPLLSRSRIQPVRRITLTELMDALNDAIKVVEKRGFRLSRQQERMDFIVSEKSIDEIIDNAYAIVVKNADNAGLLRFNDVRSRFEGNEKVLTEFFIPLLFLAHRGRVTLLQDEFFQEIFIKLGGIEDGRG